MLIQQGERLIIKSREIIKPKLSIGFSQIINSKIIGILSSEVTVKSKQKINVQLDDETLFYHEPTLPNQHYFQHSLLN
jgi:hypothetical protein